MDIFNYLVLSGFRYNQQACFDFFNALPKYLFVPHLPSHSPPFTTQMDWNNQKKKRLQEDE